MTGPLYIVLPTHNGSRFLDAQIESIAAQTVSEWRLLIRDDGSSDDTVGLIDAWTARESRIERLQHPRGNLGVVQNVATLLETARDRGAAAVMLADQDDVWRPRKVERTLVRLDELETAVGPTLPVLVHTDLEVVDDELEPVAASFMAFQRIHHEPEDALRLLLVQNFVTGCTVLANRPLLDLALPVPDVTPMHDWWLGLCAAAAGVVAFVAEPTVQYRQHGGNTIANKGFWRRVNPRRSSWTERWREGSRTYRQTVAQARALAERLAARGIEPANAAVLSRYGQLGSDAAFSRLKHAASLGLRTQHPLRTALLYARLVAVRPPRFDIEASR